MILLRFTETIILLNLEKSTFFKPHGTIERAECLLNIQSLNNVQTLFCLAIRWYVDVSRAYIVTSFFQGPMFATVDGTSTFLPMSSFFLDEAPFHFIVYTNNCCTNIIPTWVLYSCCHLCWMQSVGRWALSVY